MTDETESLQVAESDHADIVSDRDDGMVNGGMTRKQALNLYASHLLSTWNARTYEFSAIIFTASAYPDTLIAPAVRGIITTLASICFSTYLGRYIDNAPDRLRTLLSTITVNRASVICGSILWFFITAGKDGSVQERSVAPESSVPIPIKNAMFAIVLLLGIAEKLSGTANLISMERDWVVTVAAPDGQTYDLTHLNSMMRRIDLVCKLIAPIIMSAVISVVGLKYGICTVGSMSAISWGIEVFSAKTVWNSNSALRVQKMPEAEETLDDNGPITHEFPITEARSPQIQRAISDIKNSINLFNQDVVRFFTTTVWAPSVALSMLHISVLNYNASFISYLLNAGLSLNIIAIARASGGIVEISSTVIAPVGINRLSKHGKRHYHGIEDDEAEDALLEQEPETTSDVETNVEIGLERFGLWGVTWQFLNLAPAVLSLWILSSNSVLPNFSPLLSRLMTTMTTAPQPLIYCTLFVFISLSRLGLWIFDLTTQQLTQTMVPPSSRSSFAGIENSITNIFELGQWIGAIILHKPEQFKWLALGSFLCVGLSMIIYASWVRRMRGHLVHWESMGKCKSMLGGCNR